MKKYTIGLIVGIIICVLFVGSGAYAALGTLTGLFNNDVTVNGVSVDGNVAIIDGEKYVKVSDVVSYLSALKGEGQSTQSQTTTEPEALPQPTTQAPPQPTVAPTPTITPQPTATPVPTPSYQSEYDTLTVTYNQKVTDTQGFWNLQVSNKQDYYNQLVAKYEGQLGMQAYLRYQCQQQVDEFYRLMNKALTELKTQYDSDIAALKVKYGI